MLTAKGYKVVHSSRHCALEFGKDILAIDPNGVGCAFQLKSGNKSISLSHFRNDIQLQLVQLMAQKVVFPGFPDGPHKSYFVTNGYLEEEVIRAIDDLNRAQYRSKIKIWDRGDLIDMCKKLGTKLWPCELEDSKQILEIYLSNPQDMFPLEKTSKIIEKALKIENNGELFSKINEWNRSVTSAAVLIGILTSSFKENENHFALISAWTYLSVSVISSAEKHGFRIDGVVLETLNLAEKEIFFSVSKLFDEVLEKKDMFEGSSLPDSFIIEWRIILLLGVFSALGIYDNEKKYLNEEKREFLKKWLKEKRLLRVWGEGAFASIGTWILWLRANDSTLYPDEMISSFCSLNVNLNKPHSSKPLVTPYYSFQQILNHLMGFGNKSEFVSGESFSGCSFTSKTLYSMLIRTCLKQRCRIIWPDLTRITHRVCVPDNSWEYCRLRIDNGKDVSEILPNTKEWKELREEVKVRHPEYIPEELRERPAILSLWWQIAPYRYTTWANNELIEKLVPGWEI
jgi:hypothetical protein